ncbi:ketodeoxygluconokinase [Arenicella chitinivorans]|uniref:2-dehydro-3-deoxygluconokinase n=1 Tax=Arenicella chitinivorans TaxID=1329800 RepID=A0A918RH74_9GAMM|nr:sugar kinase [Arenicella chitinivorans]GGZ97675.1 ketodeoxygluconokinase [Arenicella chitinivorans]
MSDRIAVIGECMLELRTADRASLTNTKPLDMGFGGDTLNTSIYMARAGMAPSYITALGDDALSTWLLESWEQEGIACDQVVRMPNSVPGMYMINVDAQGERSFLYWRKHSPASRLFDDLKRASDVFSMLRSFPTIYLSGISLAILPEASRERLIDFLVDYSRNRGAVLFDGNYRPALWQSPNAAQSVFQRLYGLSQIALPTYEDESDLFGYQSPAQAIDAITEFGAREIVLKMGAEGCLARSEAGTEIVPSIKTEAVDTTAAGDSFNAGFLAARLRGADIVSACQRGHELASRVIQHRGAIIPA